MPTQRPIKSLSDLMDGGVDLFAFDRLLCHVQRGTGGVAVGFPEGEGESLSPDEFGLLLKEATLFFSGRRQVDRMQLKRQVKDDMTKYLYAKTKRKPMILPVIMNV